ncbi:hypothetical protein FRC17_010372 [Serendipita sp. 399]|nr:hypothetical protein FRC17_010372 [Serendipita sp. 399]
MGISMLPAELLQQILRDAALDSDAQRPSPSARRVLLAVCFQWRDILLNTQELWTFIRVVLTKTDIFGQELRFQNGLSRLKLDLQRAGSQLLDVYWNTEVDWDHARRIFGVIKTQAPFDRWRSLEIASDRWEGYLPFYFPEDHRFDNLASLKICQYRPNGFLPLIGKTISSSFRVFHATDSAISYNLLTFPLSTLLFKATDILLPELTGHLQTTAHIQQLIVEASTYIIQFIGCDWSSLSLLDINFKVPPSSRNLPQTLIPFPRLHTLSVRGGYLQPLAYISAPQLAHLRLSRGNKGFRRANQNLNHTLSHPSYTLSPVGKLQVDFPIEPLVLARLIAQSPAVESLALVVDDLHSGWDAIRRVICECKYEADVAAGSQILDVMHLHFMRRLKTLEIHMSQHGDIETRDTWFAHMPEIFEATHGTQLETIACYWPDGAMRRLTRSTWSDALAKEEPKTSPPGRI